VAERVKVAEKPRARGQGCRAGMQQQQRSSKRPADRQTCRARRATKACCRSKLCPAWPRRRMLPAPASTARVLIGTRAEGPDCARSRCDAGGLRLVWALVGCVMACSWGSWGSWCQGISGHTRADQGMSGHARAIHGLAACHVPSLRAGLPGARDDHSPTACSLTFLSFLSLS
jgi:hypothetical protein